MALWERMVFTDAAKEIEEIISFLTRLNPFPWGDAKREQKDAKQQTPTARQVRHALGAAATVDSVGIGIWKAHILRSTSLIQFGGVAAAVSNILSPQGPGCCDHNGKERTANILTSLPYMAIGVESMRRRKTPAGKAWAGSLVGVGAGSMTFHASSGKWRQWGRRMDYWAIALSTCMLTRAIYPDMPPALTTLSVAATPFKPFLVSAFNTLAMELRFLHRAMDDPQVRQAQRVHSAAALASMALFSIEDHVPHIPFIHASWHCLSALGCSTVNAVLKDEEDRGQGRSGGMLGSSSSEWDCCCSIASREGMGSAVQLQLEPLKV